MTYEAALGYPMAPLVQPRAQRLQNKHRYLEYLVAFIKYHRLVERAVTLESSVTYPPMSEQIQEYEKLDKLCLLEGIAAAENKQCHKLRMGNIPLSPVMKGVWKQLHAWT